MRFLSKELYEILKTSRKIVLPVVLIFFGILSPLTAKYISELLANMDTGFDIVLPDPTLVDSYTQLFSNLAEIGMIVLIFVVVGSVVEEKNKGSVYLVLTKNITRSDFILSKFVAYVLLYTVSYVLMFLVFGYYTLILFPEFSWIEALLPIFLPYVYGVLIISMALFFSTIAKNYLTATLFTFLGFTVISLLTLIPSIKNYVPSRLGTMGLDVLTNQIANSTVIWAIIISIITTSIFVFGSIRIFKHQEL